MISRNSEVDLVANAIADSFHMAPNRWMAKYGDVPASKTYMPNGHKHLIDDYKETKAEMQSQAMVIKPEGKW